VIKRLSWRSTALLPLQKKYLHHHLKSLILLTLTMLRRKRNPLKRKEIKKRKLRKKPNRISKATPSKK
jgi:hypothetical protein